MNVPADRLPPQNIEAEQSVLGSILLDRDAIASAIELLRPDDFYHDVHQIIFKTVVRLYDENRPVDVVTLTEELRRQGELERVGGLTYLTTLARTVPTSANVRHYSEIVEAKSLLRSLIQKGTIIVGQAYEATDDPKVLLDQAEQMIFDISQHRLRRPYSMLKVLLKRAFDRLEQLYETGSRVTGVPTGFADLDDITSGFQPADLIILAGRPSQGKTALAVNIARLLAVNHELAVGLFSLEMSAEQLALRFLAAEGFLDSHRLRSGNLADSDFGRISDAMGRLGQAPIYIDDTPSLSALEVRTRARRMKRDHDVAIIIIDYLQLMRGSWRTENRQQEISEISRGLKALARELEIPVMALSQLSRAVELRPDRRPQLSDLRESGAIEQDADVVSFIHVPQGDAFARDYRGAQYRFHVIKQDDGTEISRLEVKRDPRAKPLLYDLDGDSNPTEVVIAKQRNGPTGSVFLNFQKKTGRFAPMDPYRQPPPGATT